MKTAFAYKRTLNSVEFILAVDPAKKTGLALFRLVGEATRLRVELADAGAVNSDKLVPYVNKIGDWLTTYGLNEKNTIIAVETWTFSRNLKTVLGLGRAQQRILDALEIIGLDKAPVYLVNANTWQANILGRNRQTKLHAMHFATMMHPGVALTEDVADAIGIGHYMAGLFIAGRRRQQASRRRK